MRASHIRSFSRNCGGSWTPCSPRKHFRVRVCLFSPLTLATELRFPSWSQTFLVMLFPFYSESLILSNFKRECKGICASQPRQSIRNQIYIPTWNSLQKETKCKTMQGFLRHQASGNKGLWFLSAGSKWDEHCCCPSLLPGLQLCLQALVLGGVTQAETRYLPELRRWAGSPERARWLELPGQSTRGKRAWAIKETIHNLTS